MGKSKRCFPPPPPLILPVSCDICPCFVVVAAGGRIWRGSSGNGMYSLTKHSGRKTTGAQERRVYCQTLLFRIKVFFVVTNIRMQWWFSPSRHVSSPSFKDPRNASCNSIFLLPPPPSSSCYARGREGGRVLKLSLQNSFRIQLRLLLPPCQQASLPPPPPPKQATSSVVRSWTWDSKGVVEESFLSSNLYSVFSPFSFPCCRDNLSVCFPLETPPPSESCETTLGEQKTPKESWKRGHVFVLAKLVVLGSGFFFFFFSVPLFSFSVVVAIFLLSR